METGRVEAFSDGVFAIAITLLILAVGVDQARASGSLSHQLLHLWPAYIAYAVSFVTVGIMWINHHQLFHHFAGADRTLLLLNTLLLMSIAFTPFPTRVVAEFAHTNSDRRAAAGKRSRSTAVARPFGGPLGRRCAHCRCGWTE